MSQNTLISIKGVLARTSLSASGVYRLVKQGDFPKPIPIYPNSTRVAWIQSDVDQWVENKITAAKAS